MFSRLDILGFWQKCQITPLRLNEAKRAADLVMSFKSMYDPVQAATGVPWYGIGPIDSREESFNHKGYLGNGDHWNKKSVHVPRGRGPFKSWQEGAIDSIHISGWDRLPSGAHWDIVTLLMKHEVYNGMGYAHMGIRSPYVWGATSMQQRAKYTSDGHFDPNAWDTQLGTAAILLALKQFHGVDLNEA
jgi:lysozyme family protein